MTAESVEISNNMNTKTKTVYRGYLNLTDAEKIDFLKKVKELNESTASVLIEKIAMDVGPLSDPCPCCGR